MIGVDVALQLGFVGVIMLAAIAIINYIPVRKLRRAAAKKNLK